MFYGLNGYQLNGGGDSELVHIAVDVATGSMNVKKLAERFAIIAEELPAE